MGVIVRGWWPSASAVATHWSAPKEITPPVAEPVTRAQAQVELRIDDAYFNSSVDDLIKAARQQVERDTSQFIARATYELAVDGPVGTVLRLPYSPISEIISLTVYDSEGLPVIADEDSYELDADSVPPRLLLYEGDPAFEVEIAPERSAVIRFIGGPKETGLPDSGTYVAPAWAVQAMYRWMEYTRTKDKDFLAAYEHLVNGYRLVEVA
jgi:uncharacterized phiE125 gp8 family phage protein